MSASRKSPVGRVTFVAAGPGDAELLPMKSLRALAAADYVLADSEALNLANGTASHAEIFSAVDATGLPLESNIRAKSVIDNAKAGKQVVRLFSGDPVLDGAFSRESAALDKAKIAYDFVPGISTVSGVAAFAGVSLTSKSSTEVRIVDPTNSVINWADHQESHVTLVALNAADSAVEISKLLLAAGRASDTPVLITRAGATTSQRSLLTTLKEVAAVVKASKQSGNGMMIIGSTAAQRSTLSWFESKPLFGWRLLLPTTKDDFEYLVADIENLGATVTRVPTLSVEPPRTPQQMERAVTGLVTGRYEWIVFTCANSVKAVWEKCQEYGLDARAFAGIRLAASGDGTNAQLALYGIRADIALPDGASTIDLLDEFPAYEERTDPINRVFLPRADISTESLAAGLVELGWEVEDITAYRTVRAAPPAVEIRDAIKAGGFDAVLFTSSATVRNLVGIAGKPHAATIVCAVGPQTAKSCVEHGLNPSVQADDPTPQSLLSALSARGLELRDAAVAIGETDWRPTRRRGAGRRKVTT